MKSQKFFLLLVLLSAINSLLFCQWKQFEGAHSNFNGNKIGEYSGKVYFIINERLAVSEDQGLNFKNVELGLGFHSKMSIAAMYQNTIIAIIEELPFNSTKHLIISIDEGVSWKILETGSLQSTSLAVSENRILRGRYLSGTSMSEVVESEDNGVSWKNIGTFSEIRSIQYSDGYFYITEFDEIYRLKNGQRNWEEFYKADKVIRSLVSSNGRHLVLSQSTVVSLDDGKTWTISKDAMVLRSAVYVKDKTFGIRDFALVSSRDGGLTWELDKLIENIQTVSLYVIDTNLFFTDGRQEFLLKINGKNNYTPCKIPNYRFSAYRLLEGDSSMLYIHSQGISKLKNGSKTWQTTKSLSFSNEDMFLDHDSIIWLDLDYNLFHCRKENLSFVYSAAIEPGNRKVEIQRLQKNVLYLSNGKIYKSDETGLIWNEIPVNYEGKKLFVESMSVVDNYLYVLFQNQIYYSFDAGNIFYKVPFNTPGNQSEIWYSHLYNDGGSLYWAIRYQGSASKDYRIFRINHSSIEAEWNGIDDITSFFYGNPIKDIIHLSRFSISSIALKGLFIAEDGMNWKALNPSTPFRFPTDLLLKEDKLFVATEDEGIWYIDIGDLKLSKVVDPEENAQLNIEVFPNPATSIISFSVDKKPYLVNNIIVFDCFGKQIFSHQSNPISSLDLSFLSGGLYFIQLNRQTIQKILILK
ncbi:MAG: T9SS type A sorting domain-containing protein [Saprospiraceae bacterium]|nr:T9SS type A sorting domain-containing protein [Saprospiraceae bacterium]